ncbi:F1 complex, delta/epsilon subunit of ATPase [Linnemannia elongata]|uniref:ATP synthase subunit delta, mitochondrial n=1 Tax=Linnemannia elongata AG-77 TaxID=1314771 RepID=A0A197JMZ2_9FUNG|nr:delta subunit of the central stalk of mitochondrial F1F0 ATP synthase, atp16 [Linnemannia elongata]KAG0060630.1 delta subunit of the central stalk of mitochondrial F1F0 ATP synthase, atp16 [Linnemannia elongata]KAH7051845.1 F1 complex, delta/epsilon subunit of ATPase [Linnemannia elongata]OAQ26525.1 putative ATP synthase delta chain precursor, mitochondrial [Linnemannia elongata AG-77]
MNFLARSVRAVRPVRMVRSYATEAASAGLRLTFAVPHQTIFKDVSVTQVNIAAVSGDMGILASHVPSIEQLRPGVVEVIEATTTKKFFVSGGFATMNPDSTLNINAVEAFPVEEFSAETVRHNLAEAQRLSNSAATEEEKLAAKIEVEVLESLQAAILAK